MASNRLRLAANAAGDLYVDETCIDCATCRWMAPHIFDAHGGQSRVHTQPTGVEAVTRGLMALVACPTASIGTVSKHPMKPVLDRFPDPIAGDDGGVGAVVYHLGYHAASSFGAASYLVVRETGNLMIDVPRWSPRLARQIDALGGVQVMFLSHRDDVADHERYAAHFSAERVLHVADRSHGTAGVERFLEGDAQTEIAPGAIAIPTPGHTRGSVCLLVDDTYLFSGDHLAWSMGGERLTAFRGACWYDWPTQLRSMRRLLEFSFSWVLPGHGARVALDPGQMRTALEALIASM